jgi:AcrR family transcriptional regulator
MPLTAKSALAAAPLHLEERAPGRALEARRDQIAERSRQIVDAAYELLDAEGLEGLTIRAVLAKTGLARRAFYECFADKDELVLTVFEHTIRLAADRFSDQVRALANPMERLRLIVTCLGRGRSSLDDNVGERASRHGAAMSREHLRLAESRPDDLQAALNPLLGLIAQQLADGMKAGSVRFSNPQRLATLVYNLVATTVHTELLAERSGAPDWAYRVQFAEEIWEFCRRAVAA